LILRPAGLFGKSRRCRTARIIYALAGLFALCVPMLGIYPIFMMKLLCFAMFACAFNLLLGFQRNAVFRSRGFFWDRRLRNRLVGDVTRGNVPAILAGRHCRCGPLV